MSTAVVRLAEARAILGGERDLLRSVWDELAHNKDRRVLLLLGGVEGGYQQAMFVGRAWVDLPAELRSKIKVGLARFRQWAARLEDGEIL